MMEKSKGTDGEDIGRPGPWGEGRYQQPGRAVDESVQTPPATQPNADTRRSTTVTKEDYESSQKKSPPEKPD